MVAGRVFLLDMAWPDHRVGVEVDGWDAHRTRTALDHGADRGNLLMEAGWRILHVTSRSAPPAVVRQLQSFLSG